MLCKRNIVMIAIKEYLKTKFFVKSSSSPSIFPYLMRTFVEFWETPLDKATYNWP